MGREVDNTIYYQFAADPNWDYSTGKLPSGYEPEWKWEERYVPVAHTFNNEELGPHKYRREKIGKQNTLYGFPMLISATDIEKIDLVEIGSDDEYTYYRLDTTWDSGVVSSSDEPIKIIKGIDGADGTDGKDGETPALQVPAETWFNTVAELKANTDYVDGERYGVFENTTVYIYDAGSIDGEQPDDNPGTGRYEVDYTFDNQYATIPDVEAVPMVQAAKGITPYLLQHWWNLTARQTDIKTRYEANSDTNAFTDAEKTKLGNALTSVNTDIVTNDSLLAPGVTATDSLDGLAERFNNYPLWDTWPVTNYDANPPSVNTITTTVDGSLSFNVKDVLRLKMNDNSYRYGYVKAMTPSLITVHGDILDQAIISIEYEFGNNNAVTEDELEISSDDIYLFSEARPDIRTTAGGSLTTPANAYGTDVFFNKPFYSSKGTLVYAFATAASLDSSVTAPILNVKFDGINIAATFTVDTSIVESSAFALDYIQSVGEALNVNVTNPGGNRLTTGIVIHLFMFNDKDPV